MSHIRTGLLVVGVLFFASSGAQAAKPKEIEDAIKNGAAYLKKSLADANGRDGDTLGPTALGGLALLEAGTPANDPTIKKITARIRDASYSETRTYQITLCILYLDRLDDPADRPLIQMLGVRLVAGQNPNGGWTYDCIAAVPPATERFLRTKLSETTLTAGKQATEPAKPAAAPGKHPVADKHAAGKLHADVEKYRQGLMAAEYGKRNRLDDNSNTQFGVLGVWTARKHGVPVEHALDLIEKRFLATQFTSGGWPYSALGEGSPAMTCAGLLGLATAVGRREERVLKAEVPALPPKKPNPPEKPNLPEKPKPPAGTDPNDPFFNPPESAKKPPEPAKAKPPEPAKAKPRKPDTRDAAIKRAMDNLADALTNNNRRVGRREMGNVNDLYFLWSMERVGVIFGIDKIGKTDWYAYGVDRLIPAQNEDGSWGGRGPYGADVETAFAILFLARSNLARDLSAKVQRDHFGTELRAGNSPPAAPAGSTPDPVVVAPKPPEPMPTEPPQAKPAVPPAATSVVPIKPPAKPKPATGTTSAEIATELFRATGADWTASLKRVRDAKGAEYTSAILAVLPLLDGDRKKQAREALAERLCRMNATTLRGMLKADDAELRRAAALACAMKDDKAHVPDLIAVLEDKDENVTKAAHAGLKSLTGKDFATPAEWRAWHAKEK